MKKLLLFVIACTLGLFGTVSAQDTITIGDGSAGENYAPPIDLYYSNAISQQIFPASSLEIPSGSVISRIAFKRSGGSAPTRTWSIYMQNSESGVFVYPEYTVSSKPVESSDKVYSGTFTVPSEENVWVPFDLTEPFTYEGGDLILTVIDNTGSSGGDQWWVNSFGFGSSVHGGKNTAYNEGANYSFNQSYTYTSDIQLTYTAGEGGEELASSFYYDFNDASVDDWTKIDADGDGNNWGISSNGIYAGYEGTAGLYSSCFVGTVIYPDNYFVTNEAYSITETSVLSFLHAESDAVYNQENFGVVVSENGIDWEVVWSNRYASDETHDWAEENVSLAAYAGKNLYLGFRHYECDGNNANGIKIDNVKLYVSEGGEGGEDVEEPETPVISIIETGTDKNPNANSNFYLPVYDYSAYSMSQQIYTAEELGGAAGKIHSVAFKLGVYSRAAVTRQYEVYLTTTALNAFNGYNFITLTEADKVFDGSVEISGVVDTWYTINLDKAFDYAGGNLVLTVYDKTGVVNTSNYHQFYKYPATGRALYMQGSVAYDMLNLTTGTSQNYVSQVQLGMELDPAPTAPQNVVATATSSSEIELTWGAVAVAESYNVYSGENVVATGVTSTSYTVSGLDLETEYCYKVTSVNELGESAASAEVCVTTLMPAPEAPANLAVASVGEMSIDLTWEASATAESYKVYQGETLVATGVTATEYTVEGLNPETEYCFTVAAVNGGGESAKSDEACGTTTEFTGCYVYFTLNDSYGDGWNGNKLTVAYGGKSETISFEGSGTSYKEKSLSMGIPSGAHVTITYNKTGSYPDENSFVVSYESGEEILNIAQGSLSATTSWEFDVDCTPKAPAAPVAKAEVTGDSTIALTWNSVPTATSYKVYEGAEVVATVTETTYTFEGLTASTQYCYAVSAINEVGEGEVSETVCATTFAEGTTIVSIGEGGIEQLSAPIYNIGSTVYSLSQQIYTYDEIGLNGSYANIQGISFHKLSGSNNVRNIVVYLQNVDKEAYTGSYDWIPFTDADIVYQGEFNFGVAGDWVTINFPTEFEYTGGNLAVTVYDKTGFGYGYDYAKCDKFTSSQIDNWRGMYVTKSAEMDFSQLSTYYGTAMNTGNYATPANVYYINSVKLRLMQLEGEPIAPAPTNLVATVNGYSSITLTWDTVETARKYNVYAGAEKIATVTEPTYTLAGLEAETEYCFTVTTVNSGGESEASEEVCSTTEEFNGCFVNFTLTDSYNDGWDGCSLVVEYDGLTETFNCPASTSPKTYTVAISQGSTAKVTYTKGSNYPQEKGIIVTYESGKEILNIAQGSLSETTSWEFVVDCTPEAPGIATATAEVTGDETIVLTMSAIGAESFNIYLGEELVATTTENVYTVEGLTPETEYCFTVEAVNEVGKSEELSEAACATTYKAGTVVVQIGEGTENYASTSPVNEFYNNSISQTVYTAEEIGFGAGIIKSIAYNKYSGSNNDRNIAVYMKNVENADLTTGWEALTEDLCVYDGYYNFGTTGWTEIKLQKDFEYAGGDLLVCVLDKTGAYAGMMDHFYTYVTSSLRSIYCGSSQSIDPYNINVSKYGLYNNNYNTVAPQAKFVIEPETLVISIIETGTDKNPDANSNYYLPVYDYSAYSMSQQIYTAEELGGAAGKIHSVAFKLGVYTRAAVTRQYEVYLTTTALNAFNGNVYNGYNFITLTEADKVFDGSVEISGEIDTWYTINLDKAFDYAGGNLVLTVYDKTGVANTSNYHQFYKYSATGRALYMQGSAAYDMLNLTTGTSQNYVSQVQLGMELDLTLKAPQNVVATATSSSEIELTWGALAVAESYNVYAGTELVANVEGTSYTVTGLDAATEYCFTVTSVNELGESEASAEVCATTLMPAPEAPANLAVASVGEMSVSLTWDASATAESYKVYQGETLVATGVTATEYTVEGLTPETEYCFTVSAVNGGGESAKSDEACGTTTEFTGCYVHFTLTDSWGDGWNGNTLTVSYDGVSQTIGFPAVLGGQNDKTKTHILPLPQGAVVTLTYVKGAGDTYPVENGFVVAYESGKEILRVDEGALSGTVTFDAFTVDCAPKAPDAPVAKAEATGGSSITLTWNAVPTATSYNVYEGTEVVATVTETTYTFEGLTVSTQYCYAVSAINEIGESEVSETVCATTFAEGTTIVSIGEGGIEQFSAPIYDIGSTVYSLSQQIYTYDEIGLNGSYANIQGISFHKLSGSNNVRNIVVYLQNVDKEAYTGSYDWIPFTDADIVYQGEFNFGVAGDWVTINFPTEFEYTGGNLAVTVYDKTGFGYDYDYAKCDKFTSSQIDNWRAMYVTKSEEMDLSQLSTYYGTAMNTGTYGVPQNVYYINSVKLRLMQLEGDPIAPAPSNVVATANGYSLITLTWDAVETANKYNVYAGTEKIATVTEPTYTHAGLEAETEYCFTVTTINSGGESEASEEVCSTTTEFNGCYVNFTLSDQYNDGWDGCSLVVEYDGMTETFNCPWGESPKTYTVAISQGSTAKVTYTKGSDYPQEKGIIVTYESGKEILNIAQGSLTETTSWEFVVDCTPEAPGIATATAEVTGDSTIVLTMSAIGAESFNIYLGEELVATTTENVYTVEGLTPETEYCFTVEAVNEVGKSEELSEAVCATTYKAGTATVQIGEGTEDYVSTSPVNEFFNNSISQTVYTAEEIGFGAGSIKSIAYNKYSGGNNDRNIAVYMKNVENADLTTGWEALTEDLCVYDGYYNFGTTGWTEIKLQKDFEYAGGDLLVCVLDKTGAYAGMMDHFYTYVTSSLRSIYCGDGQSIDPYNINLSKYSLYNNNYNTVAPQAKFVIEPAEGGEEGGEEPTDPETPSTDNNRLVSVTQDNNWDNLTYVYESQTSNKVLRVLKGVDQGYGMYVTVLEYDDNGVIIGSEYKWLENGALTNSNYIDEYEYTYTEGVLTSYTQTSGYDYYGTPTPVEYVLTHDANGNVETVVYGTNKIVYTYEDGKLVKEVMSYVMNGVEETEYEVDYAYENGNCISATQYSVLEGERIARKATEYFYDLTVEAEDVFSFVYPHEVKPASVNVLTKVLSYEYQEDYFSGAITKSNIKILTYNYNFEVESVSFPPMGLSARAISDTQIELSWVATEETEKFAVYQNDTYIGESESTYFTVEGLTANTEYCFTVKGVNGEVESEASEAACAKTMDVISVEPTTIAFGELRLGEYWSEREVTVGVNINRLGKTITSITCDDAFFTLPTDIDLTSEYIWFEMGYDKTAAAGEYTATLTVTLESGVTVEIPVTATGYAPATPDVFELAQAVTFTEGVYTDTPDFATLHDDYAMPNENEWDETDAPDAVYSFTLEEESVVNVNVTGENAQYAIYKAEGFEAPYEGNVFTGEVKNLNTEFVYNFDNNSLADFTIVDNDEYKDFTWAIEEGEKGYQLVSYSYYGWYAEDNSWTWINKADERLITNNAYPISAKSVLSFDMNVNGNFEEIIIEVTKDGETFTEIERITETSYSYDWLAKSVNVGEKLAELGLEYGDYQIVLYHKVDGYGKLNIDNLVLAERVRTYPVGEYYLFAAAESAFTVEVNATPAKDVTFEPEIPVAKAYRLESIESFNVESYVYDEIYTNRVLSYVGSDGLDNILTYNKAGQLETVKSVSIIEGEDPQVISSIEYAYNEDGTLASYSESSPHPITGAMVTTTTEYTYENGRLVKVENADYEVETTLGYNEDGTVKEIVESYMTTIMTYENGKLVKKAYGYEDEETGEFVTEAEDIYTYDANGNCVKQESYEEGKLYQVYEFYYDVKIAAEDVYSFELPHLAMTNVEPSSNNILVKKLSYYSYFDEEVGEVLTHSYDVTIYHYNPAVEMAPITPINLVAEVVDGVVELTWEKFIDAETFTVYQDGEIIAQNVEEGAYTVEDLEAGEYCFAVRAYNKTGASATTEEVCVEIKESGDDPVVPEAPVVTPEATSDSTIVLTWAAVDGATNYNVYSADTLVANVTETTYTVTGLEAEKEYCFNVTAVNEVGGESAKSEKACATTLKEGNDPVVLEAPVVQVVEITETTIVIAWNQVESATNYKVFANDQLITTLPDTIAGFRELTPNTEYCFTVVAINEVGDESAPSEKVCATTSGEGIAENAAAFNIYPNPVADKLFIETEATVEEVTIYTLTGVMIYSEVDYNNNTINVSDLSGGVYFIKVRTDNGEVVKRFIKK